MTTWVALLRGVNVGGHGKLPMAELRRVAEGCGFGDARTYIQSGNLVFTSDQADAGALAAKLREAIASHAGFDPPMALRTRAQLESAVRANPFPAADAAHLHVTFLLDPDSATLAALDTDAYLPEQAAIVGSELYMHLPNGLGRSRLAADLSRRRELAGTTRNWRTVTTLLAMAGEAG